MKTQHHQKHIKIVNVISLFAAAGVCVLASCDVPSEKDHNGSIQSRMPDYAETSSALTEGPGYFFDPTKVVMRHGTLSNNATEAPIPLHVSGKNPSTTQGFFPPRMPKQKRYAEFVIHYKVPPALHTWPSILLPPSNIPPTMGLALPLTLKVKVRGTFKVSIRDYGPPANPNTTEQWYFKTQKKSTIREKAPAGIGLSSTDVDLARFIDPMGNIQLKLRIDVANSPKIGDDFFIIVDRSAEIASPQLNELALTSQAACTNTTHAPVTLPACSTATPAALASCVNSTRYQTTLTNLVTPISGGGARTPIGQEHGGTPEWQRARDTCTSVLQAAGFTNVGPVTYDHLVDPLYVPGSPSRHSNIQGTLPGTDLANEHVYLGAHLDSIPDPDCAGADDNGTGLAGVLEAAQILATAAGRYRRTLIVSCWDEEEYAALGSGAQAITSRKNQEVIAANFVLEMLGSKKTADGSAFPISWMPTVKAHVDELLAAYPGSVIAAAYSEGLQDAINAWPSTYSFLSSAFTQAAAAITARNNRGDFIALVSNPLSCEQAGAYAAYATAAGLPTVTFGLNDIWTSHSSFNSFRRSDHVWFWDNGYPGLMIGDTADFRNPRYHCIFDNVVLTAHKPDYLDTLDSVDMDFAVKSVRATVGAVAEALLLQP